MSFEVLAFKNDYWKMSTTKWLENKMTPKQPVFTCGIDSFMQQNIRTHQGFITWFTEFLFKNCTAGQRPLLSWGCGQPQPASITQNQLKEWPNQMHQGKRVFCSINSQTYTIIMFPLPKKILEVTNTNHKETWILSIVMAVMEELMW